MNKRNSKYFLFKDLKIQNFNKFVNVTILHMFRKKHGGAAVALKDFKNCEFFVRK